MERTTFRALGTDVELFLDVPSEGWTAGVFASVRREIARLEAVLSRFRLDSELSTLNREGRVLAGPDLLRVTELALEAREGTGGLFDPTVHDALVAAGYDRTFEEVGAGGAVVAARPARCGGAVTVDAHTGEIVLEPGVRLDFGGIGKGYAVDRACDLLARYGRCLASAGGDLAVRGGAWPVGVETGDGTTTLELSSGAIATSGSDRRRWATTAGDAHHLIDPRTGAPAESDLLRVTVVGRSAVEAEVLAKVLYLLGADGARVEAERRRLPAVLVPRDGEAVLAGGLA
jgi:thiamine biosynthesis lipoprotein